jgi:predicted phage tail protein
VAEREKFFRFSGPLYAVGFVFVVMSALGSQGIVFVLVMLGVSVVLIGMYYLVWRWLRRRRST